MKRLIPLLFLCVVSSGLTSCYKEHTCTCTVTTSNGSGGVETETFSFTIKSRRPEASLSCNAGDMSYSSGGTTDKTECDLD
jgi:hypothetical protein